MKQRFSTRTRLVSALLTLAMVFTFLPFSAFAATDSYGPIYITDAIVPDETFREYLKQFDKDGNGVLTPAERYAVTEIDVGKKNISSLVGIQFFPNLEKLYCYDNQLTELDVSKNTALVYLDCYGNKLTSLDVSKNTNLIRLSCFENQLTELDVSRNPALWILSCGINQLTELDVSQNPALKYLYCNNNQLTELDVSRNNKIFVLEANNNYLTSLNVDNTSIDIDNSSSIFAALGNTYPITVGSDRTFDLSTLPGTFDVTKATRWNGGTVRGNTLTVNAGVTKVTYLYDCGKRSSYTFTLNVTVVPDGTVTPPEPPVTPPSGGGSTGGGSTGGGSTGGGSTGGGSTGGGTPGGSTGGSTIPPEAGKYQLTVTDGVATVNGKTGAELNVKPGDKVTLTADTTKFPEDDEFGWWEISPYGSVSNTLTGQYQRTATFMMPPENVSARAMSKTAGVSTGGDGGGGAILLVGGAAVAGLVGYGVYSYVSEQQLKALLPEGVAMPENRAQTALLLWNTAGRPEPAAQPAFPDVADPDTAKAAQWCVEQGLMNAKFRGRFAPDGSSPAYKTLNAYRQLVG